MNAAVSLIDGLGLDGDRCIRVIPRQKVLLQMKVSFNVLMFFHSISLNSKYPPLNKYECPLLFVFAFGKDVLKMSISPG